MVREDIWDPYLVKAYQKTVWRVLLRKDCRKVLAEFDCELTAKVYARNVGGIVEEYRTNKKRVNGKLV